MKNREKKPFRTPFLSDLLADKRMKVRVARWFISKPKIPIWVDFKGPWTGKS
jgi:hypothetical protein